MARAYNERRQHREKSAPHLDYRRKHYLEACTSGLEWIDANHLARANLSECRRGQRPYCGVSSVKQDAGWKKLLGMQPKCASNFFAFPSHDGKKRGRDTGRRAEGLMQRDPLGH